MMSSQDLLDNAQKQRKGPCHPNQGGEGDSANIWARKKDTICIFIGNGGTSGDGIANLGTSNVANIGLSYSTALSGSPSLLQSFFLFSPFMDVLRMR